jgi:hypothetical protein
MEAKKRDGLRTYLKQSGEFKMRIGIEYRLDLFARSPGNVDSPSGVMLPVFIARAVSSGETKRFVFAPPSIWTLIIGSESAADTSTWTLVDSLISAGTFFRIHRKSACGSSRTRFGEMRSCDCSCAMASFIARPASPCVGSSWPLPAALEDELALHNVRSVSVPHAILAETAVLPAMKSVSRRRPACLPTTNRARPFLIRRCLAFYHPTGPELLRQKRKGARGAVSSSSDVGQERIGLRGASIAVSVQLFKPNKEHAPAEVMPRA